MYQDKSEHLPASLNDDEISLRLQAAPGWLYTNGRLVFTRNFTRYLDGVAFATQIADIAEKENHHPEILIGFKQVRVSSWTHDVKGISEKDFYLAKLINQL